MLARRHRVSTIEAGELPGECAADLERELVEWRVNVAQEVRQWAERSRDPKDPKSLPSAEAVQTAYLKLLVEWLPLWA